MSWTITNHILKSGATKKFIVATSFPFSEKDSVSSDWTDFTGNRIQAGNAVYGWGKYFSVNEGGTSGGQRVLEVMRAHSNNIYFTVNMNLWDYYNETTYKRGTHTYFNGYTAGKGHWTKQPVNVHPSDPSNVAEFDDDYFYLYSNYTNDINYFEQDTNRCGTSNWHTNWLSAVTNGLDGTNYYDKMFAWYLMDEPYKLSNAPGRRDCYTNQYSVEGHYDFCTAVEGGDPRPKMVDLGKGVSPDANSNWNNIGEFITILCGNNYGLNYTPFRLWYTPNMAAWCYSKISNDSQKMAMAWLPGCLDADKSSYVFYSSIIEGARGVLWWMEAFNYTNFSCPADHQNYTHQKSVYSGFTNDREFRSQVGPISSDQEVILSGSPVSIIWLTNETNGFSSPSEYPKMISNKFCALAMKHSNRYRLYLVNHFTNSANFRVGINTNEISNSNWTNVWDKDGNSNQMQEHPSLYPGIYFFSGSLGANGYNIYDIGAGNQ